MYYLKKNKMNLDQFTKDFIKIEFVESSNCYGVYPYPLFVEDREGKKIIGALALDNVADCYKVIKRHLSEKSKVIYVAIDFPKILDSDNDFVAIIKIENNQVDVSAIVYNPETGKEIKRVNEDMFIYAIKEQTKQVLKIK